MFGLVCDNNCILNIHFEFAFVFYICLFINLFIHFFSSKAVQNIYVPGDRGFYFK